MGENDDFKILTSNRCLVDFYADWCGPCQMIAKELETLSYERTDLDIIKVNTDKFQTLALKMGVMSIPALFIMENGEVIEKHTGFMTKDEIINFVNR